MSLPIPPHNSSRRELRKTVIRLRLEMHRQELRHESLLLTRPLRQLRGLARELPSSLDIAHAPLWGAAGVGLLGFLLARGDVTERWLNLGSSLYKLVLSHLHSTKN